MRRISRPAATSRALRLVCRHHQLGIGLECGGHLAGAAAGQASSPWRPARHGVWASSSSDTSTLMLRFGISMRMRSPLRTRPMAPPAAASGDAWPMDRPRFRRRSAHRSAAHKPCPGLWTCVAHGVKHFLHAGAAFGAFVTHDDDVARLDLVVRISATASSCDSVTWAGPSNTIACHPTPAVLTHTPLGAMLPTSTARPPSCERRVQRNEYSLRRGPGPGWASGCSG